MSCPAGMVVFSLPSKVIVVRLCTECGCARPTVAWPIVNGTEENLFDRWIRIVVPPRCGVTIMRTVWRSNPCGTEKPAASDGVAESVGLAVQFATQLASVVVAGASPVEPKARSERAEQTARTPRVDLRMADPFFAKY